MSKIQLSPSSVFATVSDDKYGDVIAAGPWHLRISPAGISYAQRNIHRPDGHRTTQSLHHFLMPGVERVDHKDGNGLNCTTENMRPATHQQNMRNVGKRQNNTSGFRGVDWYKPMRKWRARITVSGHQVYLGFFDDPFTAGAAYEAKAREVFGDFYRE